MTFACNGNRHKLVHWVDLHWHNEISETRYVRKQCLRMKEFRYSLICTKV